MRFQLFVLLSVTAHGYLGRLCEVIRVVSSGVQHVVNSETTPFQSIFALFRVWILVSAVGFTVMALMVSVA